ncbi:10317_t:CDS:2, partial [Ambispora gerdemannii]
WGDLLDPVYLAITSAKIEYFSKAAHAAASPWNGRNALDAVVLAYNGISLLRQQSQINNRIIMFITNGGKVVNGSAITFLSIEPDHRVENCLKSAADATGCTYKTEWDKGCCEVIVNKKLAKNFMRHMEDRGVVYPPTGTFPPGGSTDQGNVSYEVPSIHALCNIGTTHIIHTPEFAIEAEKVEAHHRTLCAATCLALTASDVLVDDQLYRDVVEEFNANVKKTKQK